MRSEDQGPTLSDGLQQVAASVANRLWRRFGGGAGRCHSPSRGGRRGNLAVGGRRRARRGRRRRPNSRGHGRWRWGRGGGDAACHWWRGRSRRGRVGGGGRGERGRGGRCFEAGRRRRDSEAATAGWWRRGRRGRGHVGASAASRWGSDGWGWGRMGGTQHAGSLLAASAVLPIAVPTRNGKSDMMIVIKL